MKKKIVLFPTLFSQGAQKKFFFDARLEEFKNIDKIFFPYIIIYMLLLI